MKTILVIEDKKEVRENIVEILHLAQYEVVSAANGKQGVELARSAKPDLILCDIMMPELDGYGVLHILSKQPVTADVPFIFLTAKADPAHFRSGMNLGADDYLTKPVDDIMLLNAVELRLKKNERAGRKPNSAGLPTLLSAVRNPASADSLLAVYPAIRYAKKQLLYADGNFPTALYFIRKGQLKCFKTDANGNSLIVRLLRSGDFVGYASLLSETAYVESAEVLAEAEVCTIPKTEFFTLINKHPDIAHYFMQLLVAELAQRDERLLKLAYQSVRQRVAEALLLVQRTFYPAAGASDEQPVSRIPAINQSSAMSLSRETWSQLVGASIETVIRALGDLRADGLIELTGSQITILDLERLSRLRH